MQLQDMPSIPGLVGLLLLAAIPVVLILIFVYLRDRNKEPLSLLILLFLGGFFSCGLVLIVSNFMESILPFMRGSLASKSFLDMILYSFIGVAFVEEACKWIFVCLIGYNHHEFDEVYDSIVYCIFVSLGFAFIENIIYVIQTVSLQTALLRAVTAVPSHAFNAVFMGYYLSLAKQKALKKKKNEEKKYIAMSVFVPTILHGIYDYCLMSGYGFLTVIFFFFVAGLYVVSIMKIVVVSNDNRKIKFKNKFCGKCGKAVTGEYCSNCGEHQE